MRRLGAVAAVFGAAASLDRQQRGKFNLRGVKVFTVDGLRLVHQLGQGQVEQRFDGVNAPAFGTGFRGWRCGGAGGVQGDGLLCGRGHGRVSWVKNGVAQCSRAGLKTASAQGVGQRAQGVNQRTRIGFGLQRPRAPGCSDSSATGGCLPPAGLKPSAPEWSSALP